MTLLLILAVFSALPEQPISTSERDALVAFFNSTGGPHWKEKTGWLSEANPCDWEGVICEQAWDGTNSGFTIRGVQLPFNNLRGEVPAAFFALPNLKILNLRGNQLTGQIPESILQQWDRNAFELSVSGSRFGNFVQKVRYHFSASGVRCAFDEDVRYVVELSETGEARFESTRCASRERDYCLVRTGEAPSLSRLGRVLQRIGFDDLAAEYSSPFTFTTHDVFVTTTVLYGDGREKSVEMYGGHGPIEAHIAEEAVLALVHQVSWKKESKKRQCEHETE